MAFYSGQLFVFFFTDNSISMLEFRGKYQQNNQYEINYLLNFIERTPSVHNRTMYGDTNIEINVCSSTS